MSTQGRNNRVGMVGKIHGAPSQGAPYKPLNTTMFTRELEGIGPSAV